MSSTHENVVSHERAKEPSNRSFGLIVGGIFIALAAIRAFWAGELGTLAIVFLALGVPLVLAGLLFPQILTLPNRAWMALGVLLAKIVNPLIMFLVFALTVVPTGLFRRLLGRDPLGLRKDSGADTYWHKRDPVTDPAQMKNQF